MKLGVSGKLGKTAGLWLAAVALLVLTAYPAWAIIFAPKNSVVTKSIKKGAVTSAKIKDKTIQDADIAAGAAIAASKINAAGLNADTLDGKHASDFVAKAGDTMSGALSAPNFTYTGAKTGRIAIPGGAFLPENEWYDYFRYGPDIYAESASTSYETYQVPVYLPDGAQITSFSYTFRDSSTTYNTQARLMRSIYTSDTNDPMAAITTAGLLNDFAWRTSTTTAIANGLVDNANYVYYIKITLVGAATFNISAARVAIEYTYDRPGS